MNRRKICHVSLNVITSLLLNVITGQSKSAGRNAVEEIIALQTRCDIVLQRIQTLQRSLTNTDDDIDENLNSIKGLESAYRRLTADVIHKKSALGLDDKAKLDSYRDSSFVNHRVNARALKARLRSKLQSRKFELQSTERPYSTNHSATSGKSFLTLGRAFSIFILYRS